MQAQIQALLGRRKTKGSREKGRSRDNKASNFQWYIVKSSRIYHGLQVIHQDEAKGGISRRAGTIDPVICARRGCRCMEGECDGRVRSRGN